MELIMAPSLHGQDFYAWTKQQADILKSGMFANADVRYFVRLAENQIG